MKRKPWTPWFPWPPEAGGWWRCCSPPCHSDSTELTWGCRLCCKAQSPSSVIFHVTSDESFEDVWKHAPLDVWTNAHLNLSWFEMCAWWGEGGPYISHHLKFINPWIIPAPHFISRISLPFPQPSLTLSARLPLRPQINHRTSRNGPTAFAETARSSFGTYCCFPQITQWIYIYIYILLLLNSLFVSQVLVEELRLTSRHWILYLLYLCI